VSDTASPTAPTTAGRPARTADALGRLHLVRSAFALVWALVLLTAASRLGPVAVVLLVLYPLVDVAAALVDARASGPGAAVTGQRLTAVVSLAAAVAVGVATTSGLPAVLRVWGTWAVVAGLVQLVVAVRRRGLGGQWPLIASGAVSALAGASFVAASTAAAPSLTSVAGYALAGGVFFLVSGVRLRGAARRTT